MRSKLENIACVTIIIYAIMVTACQFFVVRSDGLALPQLFERQAVLATITNDVARDGACIPLSGFCRNLSRALPEDARLYLPDMLGAENYGKMGYYYFTRYYMYPREVAIALDGTARQTPEGFTGVPAVSDREIKSSGFHVIVDFPDKKNPTARVVNQLSAQPAVPRELSQDTADAIIAFLLPLLAAFMGVRLLKWAMPELVARMGMVELLACGFGIGMMFTGSCALWLKMSHAAGLRLVPWVVGILGGYELWIAHSSIKRLFRNVAAVSRWHPAILLLALVLVMVFRLAGLEGMLEFDAIGSWAFKSKLIYFHSGSALVRAFSDPSLVGAHLDYPALVPVLYATTWGAIGSINEFVVKSWSAWQMVFLLAGIVGASQLQGQVRGFVWWYVLALAVLPAILNYARWEGATMSMIFFVSLGMVQMSRALQCRDRERLVLAMMMLMGAALSKNEGVVLCAVGAIGALAGFKFVRQGWSSDWWRGLLLAFVCASAFVYLRSQAPSLNSDSAMLRSGLQYLATTLRYWPQMVGAIVASCFLDSRFAVWGVVDGKVACIGQWGGLTSLLSHWTLGFGWIALLISMFLWVCRPHARRAVMCVLLMVIGYMVFLAFVVSAVGTHGGLSKGLEWVNELTTGRYMLPVMVGWGSAVVCLLSGWTGDLDGFGKEPQWKGGVKQDERSRISMR
jgi:hypothetical protein